jgi:hypothetical protein
MAITYAQIPTLSDLDPIELEVRLKEVVAAATLWLEACPDARAGTVPAEDKWSAKEVIGHLIDSAVNNLQRIVRLEVVLDIEPEVRTQPYVQDEWVRAQHYAEKEWAEIVELWRLLNAHIAWTMGRVTRQHLGRICVFPETHMTMGFLMADYIAHMEHHLRALKKWL